MRKLLIICVLLAGIACSKEKTTGLNGTIEDFTGRLDGCGYLIQLDNGKRLEPVSNVSGRELIPGRRVSIEYISKPAVSICMAGETVEITSLRYL